MEHSITTISTPNGTFIKATDLVAVLTKLAKQQDVHEYNKALADIKNLVNQCLN